MAGRAIRRLFWGVLAAGVLVGLCRVVFNLRADEGLNPPAVEIESSSVWLKGVEARVSVQVNASLPPGTECVLRVAGQEHRAACGTGPAVEFTGLVISKSGRFEMEVQAGSVSAAAPVRVISGLWSLLPPLVAIGLALAFRQVLAALWLSIWLGALILWDWHPFTAAARSMDHYIIGAMADYDNAAMLIFIIFIGGMIGMISRGGGIEGIAEMVARRARSARGGQLSAMLMGVIIFFDDYANTVIVGNTMRPITDRLRISREKLSYIVDSTAAPVASLFPISTWIGYEVGLINRALEDIGSRQSGYLVFLESVIYRFYPLLCLVLVALCALTGRDFGPMARAERRARSTGKVLRDGAIPLSSLEVRRLTAPPGKPRRWFNALGPLAVVLVVTFAGLWVNGRQALGPAGWEETLGQAKEFGPLWSWIFLLGQVYSSASPNVVLAWASLAGCVAAVLLLTAQRILSLGETMSAWLAGAESMLIAVVILLLAWSLGQVCRDLHTAEYLTHSLAGILSPRLLPALTFLIACGISFATGTSYGTMAILMPLALPIAHRLALSAGLDPADQHLILIGVVSSVLAGAVFGDHCSPISDTTIMSSMASSADHIDHVRTQLPYALLVAVVGVLLGALPTAWGFPPGLSFLLGTAVLAAFLYLFGEKIRPAAPAFTDSVREEDS